jgi:hypothetical protein
MNTVLTSDLLQLANHLNGDSFMIRWSNNVMCSIKHFVDHDAAVHQSVRSLFAISCIRARNVCHIHHSLQSRVQWLWILYQLSGKWLQLACWSLGSISWFSLLVQSLLAVVLSYHLVAISNAVELSGLLTESLWISPVTISHRASVLVGWPERKWSWFQHHSFCSWSHCVCFLPDQVMHPSGSHPHDINRILCCVRVIFTINSYQRHCVNSHRLLSKAYCTALSTAGHRTRSMSTK